MCAISWERCACTSIVQLSVSDRLSLNAIQAQAINVVSLLVKWDFFLRSHDSSNLGKQTSDLHVALSIIRYVECAHACLFCRYLCVPQVFLWSGLSPQYSVWWTQDTQTMYKRSIEARSRSHCGRRKAIKGKAVPLQAWTGPEGSRSLRIPHFKTIGT